MFYLGTTKIDRQLVYMILILSWRRGRRLELGVVVTLEADLDHQVQLVCVLRQPLDGHDVRFNLANHPDRPVEDLSDGEGVGQRQAWKAKKNKALFGHVRKSFSQSVHIKQRYLALRKKSERRKSERRKYDVKKSYCKKSEHCISPKLQKVRIPEIS